MLEMDHSFNLSDYGSLASIIGIIISTVTFLMLWNIRGKFLFNSNIQNFKSSLSKNASSIMEKLANYEENKDDIYELIQITNVELRAIERGAKGDLKRDIKASRSLIRNYISPSFFSHVKRNETQARKIKTSLSVVVSELGHVEKEVAVGK